MPTRLSPSAPRLSRPPTRTRPPTASSESATYSSASTTAGPSPTSSSASPRRRARPDAGRTRALRRGGGLDSDAESSGGPGDKGEGSVVCFGDAFDDGQAQADTGVVGAEAFGAASERLHKRRNEPRSEHVPGVLDRERDA